MIEKETRPWGVRLIATPFNVKSPLHVMRVQAEIQLLGGRSNPQIRISMNGNPLGSPLSRAEATAWIEAQRLIITEALAAAEDVRKRFKKKIKEPNTTTKMKKRSKEG